MTSRDDLRIGDAERDEVMTALREHFAQGRLTHEELDERLDTVLAARTAGELRRATADLPGPTTPRQAAHGGRPTWAPSPHADPAPWDQAFGPPWGPRPGDLAWRHAMRAARRERHRVHRRHGRPPVFLFILAIVLIASLVSGSLWPVFGVLKVLFLMWLVFAVLGLAHRRFHHHPRAGRRS
ncbi:DUF1707 SHOCT-like domain-containing protein [Sphaerisporangium album]|uniref:DUF1707 SHOCT-like domain-containing protein n=1 Tax=Sphaerisporangium album TaxID=509200 RepID=UPI0015F0CE13|nr:DUF1707 domain-containing protein [Sphaerisporangium album]